MPDLIAKSPLAGRAALTIAGTTLTEAELGPLTSIAPFPGQHQAVAAALGGARAAVLMTCRVAANRWFAQCEAGTVHSGETIFPTRTRLLWPFVGGRGSQS